MAPKKPASTPAKMNNLEPGDYEAMRVRAMQLEMKLVNLTDAFTTYRVPSAQSGIAGWVHGMIQANLAGAITMLDNALSWFDIAVSDERIQAEQAKR